MPSLRNIRVCELGLFLDNIDFLHPDLKERLSNLSGILRGILENGLPPGSLVLETYTTDWLNELCDGSSIEFFQFAPSEDTRRVDMVVESHLDKINTAGSSGLSRVSFGVDDGHLVDVDAQLTVMRCFGSATRSNSCEFIKYPRRVGSFWIPER